MVFHEDVEEVARAEEVVPAHGLLQRDWFERLDRDDRLVLRKRDDRGAAREERKGRQQEQEREAKEAVSHLSEIYL